MKSTYENQILNVCIQTFYNLNGYYPGHAELVRMLGDDYEEDVVCKQAA